MNKYIKFTIVFLFSFLCALITSAYFETVQSLYLAKLKNYFVTGSVSRFIKSDDGIERTFYNGSYYVNPVHVAQSVIYSSEMIIESRLGLRLGLHDNSRSVYPVKNSEDKNILDTADFFIKNYKPEVINDIEVVRYPYDFDYDSYDLKAPWYSGMAQAQVGVVMLSAYLLTDNNIYLEYAKKSINLLTVPVDQGGTLTKLPNDRVWFEEYADKRLDVVEHPLVLNGNLFAIDGVFLLYLLTDDLIYGDLLRNSLEGVEGNIHRYDTGFWSYYDIKKNFAHVGYHRLHIKQLKRALHYSKYFNLKEMNQTSKYVKRFEIYDRVPFFGYTQRMIYQKNNMIYLIFLIDFMFVLFLTSMILFTRRVK